MSNWQQNDGDPGVARDVYNRALKASNGLQLRHPGLVLLDERITRALSVRSSHLLASVRHQVRRGRHQEFPTSRQLAAVNNALEARGIERVSCPVRLVGDAKRNLFAQRDARINEAHAALAASRPLKPPGR